PGVHHTSGEEVGVAGPGGTPRPREGAGKLPRRESGQSEAKGREPQALREEDDPRRREEQPMAWQDHHVPEPLGEAPERPPRVAPVGVERLARAFHEPPERNRRRAGCLATA